MLVVTSNNGKLIIQLEWPNNEACKNPYKTTLTHLYIH